MKIESGSRPGFAADRSLPARWLAGAVLLALALGRVTDAGAARDLRVCLGSGVSRLEGALGGVYPHGSQVISFGLDWRSVSSPLRVRTGARLATKAGSAGRPSTIGFDWDSTGVHLPGPDRWATDWIEVPIALELAPGKGPLRAYVGAGALAAARVQMHGCFWRGEVPTSAARRVTLGALASAGLETSREDHVLTLELRWERGLQSLYAPGHGPPGSWSAWTIALEAGL